MHVTWLKSLGGIAADFRHHRNGTIATWFALSLLPFFVGVGSTFDYTRAASQRTKLQQATDSAVLAAANAAVTMTDAEIRAYSLNYVRSALGNSAASIDQLTISSGRTQLYMKTSVPIEKSFMKLINIVDGTNYIPVTAESATMINNATYEVVMVLDNSGSMSGQKIADLRTAANSLVNVLFNGKATWDRGKIAIVPFTLSVNIGASNRSASWMDQNAAAPLHFQNFALPAGVPAAEIPTSRFQMFDWLNTPWAGCVESRPHPLNVNDTPPNSNNPSSLFLPMFAPDEPDNFSNTTTLSNGEFKKLYYRNGTNGRNYSNNYLDDMAGACVLDVNEPHAAADRATLRHDRQGMVCKYRTPRWIDTRSGRGPNYSCNARPIVPLTDTKVNLTNSINAMLADGNTNLHEGVTWGWRVLSPEQPFTQGKPWGEPGNYKIIILMTDGENFLSLGNYDNGSIYSPYNHLSRASERLGVSTGDHNQVRARMDELTRQSCANSKGQAIQIYSIALGVTDVNNLNLLRNCATRADMAYSTSSSANLIKIFEEIARNISTLRLTQ